MARAILAGHLQSLPWSRVSASGPCGEGLVGGHRQPLSGPQGSVAAGAECFRTSGQHLGCRRVAGERGREAVRSPMGHRNRIQGDSDQVSRVEESVRPMSCAPAHGESQQLQASSTRETVAKKSRKLCLDGRLPFPSSPIQLMPKFILDFHDFSPVHNHLSGAAVSQMRLRGIKPHSK